MTKWNSPEFKKLQQEWYQRLEDEGFQDAEKLVDGEMVLQQSAAHPARVYGDGKQLVRESKEAYFRILGQQVAKGKFDHKVDKVILTLYAEGERITSIVRILERRKMVRNRAAVRFIIRKYKMRWGLAVYTKKQLGEYRKGDE